MSRTVHATVGDAELDLDVERVACGLLALGIEKGDRIAVWSSHSTERTLVERAAARAGAVPVILDGEWSSEHLVAVLRQSSPRLLGAGGSDRLAALAAARDELSQVARLVALDGPPHVGRADMTWTELLLAGSAIDPARLAQRERTLDPDDPISIEYEQLPGGELRTITLTHRGRTHGRASDKERH